MLDQTISQFLLFLAMATGAVIASTWLGITLWAWRDIRARSRDVMVQGAATLMVGALNVFGLVLYLMLRPRETLAETYERSLEEEALLQSIEEKPVCPGCGRPANALWQVCPYCYTRLKRPCVNCKQLLDLSWNLCPYCATQQSRETDSESRAPSRPRRTAVQPAQPAQAIPQPTPPAPAAPRPQRRPVNQEDRENYQAASAMPLEFIDGDES
jgi:RNA polymerase subunit RPABC4/transcription elongation factor Spt4